MSDLHVNNVRGCGTGCGIQVGNAGEECEVTLGRRHFPGWYQNKIVGEKVKKIFFAKIYVPGLNAWLKKV